MFEDSTFESTGRIRTRSRGWMIAATFFNGSILLALILVPLIYPEALPRQAFPFLMMTPPPPPSAPPTPARPQNVSTSGPSTSVVDPFTAPRKIPTTIVAINDPGPPPSADIGLPEQLHCLGEALACLENVTQRQQPIDTALTAN